MLVIFAAVPKKLILFFYQLSMLIQLIFQNYFHDLHFLEENYVHMIYGTSLLSILFQGSLEKFSVAYGMAQMLQSKFSLSKI